MMNIFKLISFYKFVISRDGIGGKSTAFVSIIQEKWPNGEGVHSNRNRSNDIQDDYHRSIQISIQLLRLQQHQQHQQQQLQL